MKYLKVVLKVCVYGKQDVSDVQEDRERMRDRQVKKVQLKKREKKTVEKGHCECTIVRRIQSKIFCISSRSHDNC